MTKFRVTVFFVPNETKADHYLDVTEIVIMHHSNGATEQDVMGEVMQYLGCAFPGAVVKSIMLYRW